MIQKNKKGSALFLSLVLVGIFFIILSSSIGLGLTQQRFNKTKVASTQALNIAEAGINYYKWVLYHDKEEYCNNETCLPGPDYGPYGPYEYSENGTSGFYELYITPPATDEAKIIKIKSIAWTEKHPNLKRTIEVTCGAPSWSSYAILSNSDIRFGEGTETWGPIHSNGGIRFDGIAHNIISSGVLNYDDPDHEGTNEFGVHTHFPVLDPFPDSNNPPQNVPSRPATFMSGRTFPVTTVSFDLLDNYVSDVLQIADTTDGLILNPSGAKGYHIKFNTNNTVDIKIVTQISDPCSRCVETGCTRYKWGVCVSWGCTEYVSTETYNIERETNLYLARAIPTNGIIFVKDNVWVDGSVNGTRATILAFQEPLNGSNTNIIINNSIIYTNYDGTDAIGLIAQKDILIGLDAENQLKIDAGMIAKEGMVGREYYIQDCGGHYQRHQIDIYGSIASNLRYGFSYVDGSGYDIRNISFDNNLKFLPPPHFPAVGEYVFLSWEEK